MVLFQYPWNGLNDHKGQENINYTIVKFVLCGGFKMSPPYFKYGGGGDILRPPHSTNTCCSEGKRLTLLVAM